MSNSTNELWKDVVGYEGIYQVSNFGRVKSAKYNSHKYLKNKTPSGRDVRVALWKDKKPKDFLVHRLVAEAFLPKVEGKVSINHIDGNPRNNYIDNLEWCNHKENNNHAFDKFLIKTAQQVILKNKNTGEIHEFRSMSKAGIFLGKNDKYISNKVSQFKSNEFELLGYSVKVIKPKNYTGTERKNLKIS